MKGFRTSKDYHKLWDLIQNNHRIPAWINYTTLSNGKIVYDLVEVKITYNKYYSIGVRGCGYGDLSDQIDDFIRDCETFELQWIEPNLVLYNIDACLPGPGIDIIGYDENGNRHYCYLYKVQNSNSFEWRCSVTGGLYLIDVKKWSFI